MMNPESGQLYWNIFMAASDGILIVDLDSGRILVANPSAAEMHGFTPEMLASLTLQQILHAKSSPLFANYAQLIRQEGSFEASAVHMRQNGTHFNVEWRAVPFRYKKRLCSLAVVRDVSKRVLAENQRRRRMGVRAREQAALLEISRTLAGTLELQPGLILDQLRLLIKFTHAGLFTLDGSAMLIQVLSGADHLDLTLPLRIDLKGDKSLADMFADQCPIRIADINSGEPEAKLLQSILENESSSLLEGIQSWMWIPLAVKNRVLGGIGIGHTERNYFTSHQADLAMTIANQAAVTLINSELYENARTLAVLQERQRLAQNLHDAVNQSLFSAGLIAEVLPRLWDQDQEEARESLEDLRRLTRGAQAEMRSMLAELRPSTLTDAELGDLLGLLGDAFTGRTNIPVKLTVDGTGSIPEDTQVALYRICQEVLTNIAKHAGATRVEIFVRHLPEGLDLHIQDDGVGFDSTEPSPSGHYGLAMMHERAEEVGAMLTVKSQPGQGTEIDIHWSAKEGE